PDGDCTVLGQLVQDRLDRGLTSRGDLDLAVRQFLYRVPKFPQSLDGALGQRLVDSDRLVRYTHDLAGQLQNLLLRPGDGVPVRDHERRDLWDSEQFAGQSVDLVLSQVPLVGQLLELLAVRLHGLLGRICRTRGVTNRFSMVGGGDTGLVHIVAQIGQHRVQAVALFGVGHQSGLNVYQGVLELLAL